MFLLRIYILPVHVEARTNIVGSCPVFRVAVVWQTEIRAPNWCPMSGRKFAIIKAAHVPQILAKNGVRRTGHISTVGLAYLSTGRTDRQFVARRELRASRQPLIYEGAGWAIAKPSLVDRAYKIFKRKLRRELKLTVNCHRVLNYSGRGDGSRAR